MTVIIVSNPTTVEVVLSCIEVVVGVLTITTIYQNRELDITRNKGERESTTYWNLMKRETIYQNKE